MTAPQGKTSDGYPQGNLPEGRSIWLLMAMLAYFLFAPILSEMGFPKGLRRGVFSVVLLAAAFQVSGQRKTLLWVGGAAILAVLFRMSPDISANLDAGPYVRLGLTGLFLFLAVFYGLREFFRMRTASVDTIATALCAYLMIGLFFAVVLAIATLYHGESAFKGLDPALFTPSPIHAPLAEGIEAEMVYFSFVTLTTLGYGDLIPVHPTIRSLAILEAIVGVFFLAVVIARIVAMTPATKSLEETEGD